MHTSSSLIFYAIRHRQYYSMLGNISKYFVVCCFFSKLIISKNSFGNAIRASNSLDQDQARRDVGPDLGTNCLQRLSADDTLTSVFTSSPLLPVYFTGIFVK